jgi:hypothetical protein
VSDTQQTDQRTYSANCLGKTLVVNADWAKLLERENAALREAGRLAEGIIVQRTDEIRHLERENEKLRAELWSAHYQLDNSPRPSNEDLEKAFEWLQKNAPVSIRYMTGNDPWNLPPAYCVLVKDRLFYGTTVFHAVCEAMRSEP